MTKILLVEDDKALRDVYFTILDLAGYSTEVAEDGVIALRKCEENVYDLILLDLMMPGIDGIGFLERANLSQKAPATKTIAFSNLSVSDTVQKAFKLGARKHILKAMLTPKELLALIQETLEQD